METLTPQKPYRVDLWWAGSPSFLLSPRRFRPKGWRGLPAARALISGVYLALPYSSCRCDGSCFLLEAFSSSAASQAI